MPTPTYDLIASNVLGSSAASVTFSSIPATYRDLILVIAYPGFFNGANITLNNDTGSNYSRVSASGSGSTASSFSASGSAFFLQTFSEPAGGNHIIQIFDYSTTDKHKTGLSRLNLSDNQVLAAAARWGNTAAINEIDLISLSGGQFAANTTFHLYGISA